LRGFSRRKIAKHDPGQKSTGKGDDDGYNSKDYAPTGEDCRPAPEYLLKHVAADGKPFCEELGTEWKDALARDAAQHLEELQ